jgi:hypothetical protein
MACLVFDVGIAFYVDLLQEYPEVSVSSKFGSVGAGVLAVEVSCTEVVIEDGVVASSSVMLNCTVLLSVAL